MPLYSLASGEQILSHALQVAYRIGLCWHVCKTSLCIDETKGVLVLFEHNAEKEQLAKNPKQATVMYSTLFTLTICLNTARSTTTLAIQWTKAESN